MNKLLRILILLIFCILLLPSCKVTSANITTKKSGSLSFNVVDPKSEKENDKSLTPLTPTDSKKITDDGLGLYNLKIIISGSGTASSEKTKYHVGDKVNINTNPGSGWEYNFLVVNYEEQSSLSFTMPDHDVEVCVVFKDLSHYVYSDHYCRMENNAEKVIEGTKYYFNVTSPDDGYHYYEDEDVRCRSYYEIDGEYVYYKVTKEAGNLYSFIAPSNDCYLYLETRELSYVGELAFYEKVNNDATRIDNYENYCSFSLMIGDEKLNIGDTYHHGTLTVNINPLDRYEVDKIVIQNNVSTKELIKIDDTNYSISLDGHYSFLLIYLKEKPIPEGSYRISLENPSHGTISCSKYYAAPGDNVSFDIVPETGYRLGTLAYSKDGGEYINIYSNDVGNTNLEMPDGNISVKVTFILGVQVKLNIVLFENGEKVEDYNYMYYITNCSLKKKNEELGNDEINTEFYLYSNEEMRFYIGLDYICRLYTLRLYNSDGDISFTDNSVRNIMPNWVDIIFTIPDGKEATLEINVNG